MDFNLKVHLLSDGTGYYVISKSNSVSKVMICKYLFSSPSTALCQSCSNTNSYNFIQLYFGNNQFYLMTKEMTTSVDLLMCKFTYGDTSVSWAKSILCPGALWDSTYTDGTFSSDGSIIYNLLSYGLTGSLYAHFFML